MRSARCGVALAAREVAHDQVGQEVVLERDEVGARAVERIGERGRLAAHAPAIGVEVARRAVRELAEALHVEELRAGKEIADRAVAVQELDEALRGADAGLVARRIADDADADHAVLDRDEPDPVAGVAEVHRRERARRVADARAEGFAAEVVEVGDAGEASPDRADLVVVLLDAQPLRLRDHAGPPARVEHPLRLVALRPAARAHLEAVRRAALAERELLHGRVDVHLGPGRDVHAAQVLVDPSAVELERGMEREALAPDLAHLLDVRALGRVVEEVAEAVLRELLLVHVAREPEPPDQVVARELDGGLADPVVRLGGLLELRHGEAGERAQQLADQRIAREPASDHRDVELSRLRRLHETAPFQPRGEA